MLIQYCEGTECHWIVYFKVVKMINFMVYFIIIFKKVTAQRCFSLGWCYRFFFKQLQPAFPTHDMAKGKSQTLTESCLAAETYSHTWRLAWACDCWDKSTCSCHVYSHICVGMAVVSLRTHSHLQGQVENGERLTELGNIQMGSTRCQSWEGQVNWLPWILPLTSSWVIKFHLEGLVRMWNKWNDHSMLEGI
jgi:hypothetical protein